MVILSSHNVLDGWRKQVAAAGEIFIDGFSLILFESLFVYLLVQVFPLGHGRILPYLILNFYNQYHKVVKYVFVPRLPV
jgi:hypothetical protein